MTLNKGGTLGLKNFKNILAGKKFLMFDITLEELR